MTQPSNTTELQNQELVASQQELAAKHHAVPETAFEVILSVETGRG